MKQIEFSICHECAHLESWIDNEDSVSRCPAFPEGIPDEVWDGVEFLHIERHPDQKGDTVFEPIDEDSAKFAEQMAAERDEYLFESEAPFDPRQPAPGEPLDTGPPPEGIPTVGDLGV